MINKTSLIILILVSACTTIKFASKEVAELLTPISINSALPEFGGSMSKKGNELYFNRTDSSRAYIQLLYSTQVNKVWQAAKPVHFSDTSVRDIDPFITADGSSMFFSSNRTHASLHPGYNIWQSNYKNKEWSDPMPLDTILNSSMDEVFCSLSKNGTIYFARFEGSQSRLYFSVQEKGQYQKPIRLNIPIHDTIRINNPAIAPDESYIIFVSGQLGTRNADLYLSKRISKNEWAVPKNLGPSVNTNSVEFAPFISPDGKWLYFTSERPGVVQEYPQGLRRPGDIYRVGLKGLAL